MICPKCSHWIAPPGKTCPNCGYSAAPAPRQAPPVPAPQQQVVPDPFNPPTLPVVPPFPPSSAPLPVELQHAPPQKQPIPVKTWFILGGLLLAGIALLRFLSFAREHPFMAFFLFVFVGLGVGFVALIMAGMAGSKPQFCYVCNNSLSGSRRIYHWNLDGASRRVCADCNQSLRRKNSRDAMNRRKQQGGF